MGTITRGYTFVTQAVPTAAEWNQDINQLFTLVNGQLDAANVDTSSSDGIMTLDAAQTATGTKTFNTMRVGDIEEVTNGAGGLQQIGAFRYDPADENVADGDGIYWSWTGDNDAATPEEIEYARIATKILDASDGTEDGEYEISVMTGGTLTDYLKIGTSTMAPASDSAIDLGLTSLRYRTLFVDTIGDTGQALAIAATTMTLPAASTTIQTTSNNTLNLSVGTGLIGITAGTGVNVVGDAFTSQSTSAQQDVTFGRTDTPGGAQTLVNMVFTGDDDGGNATAYAALLAKSTTVTGGSEDGSIEINRFVAGTSTLGLTVATNIIVGKGSNLADLGDTFGHLQIPTCAGTPTGAVTDGSLIVDVTNHKLYFRSGSQWRDAGP